MPSLGTRRLALLLLGVVVAIAVGGLVWLVAFASPFAFRSDCEQVGPSEWICERPIGPGRQVQEPTEPAEGPSPTPEPQSSVELADGKVLGIGFRYPAEWRLDEAEPLVPHSWTPLVLSHRAALNCTRGDLAECAPTLDPGGALVWWVTVVPYGREPDGGEVMTVDGRDLWLFEEDDMCDQITQTGGGIPRGQVDRAVGATILNGAEGHYIHGCFRDPGAAPNYDLFLEFLESIDFPERHPSS